MDPALAAPRHPRPERAARRVVVTGGAGFLGSHLCTALVAQGVEVVALDNFLTGSPGNVAHLMHEPGFRLVRCDVTDFVHVPGRVDLVLHFASPASPLDYLRMPVETLKVGSVGTWHALGLAKEKGARFVLASTSEVYGDPQVHPQPETYWGHVNPIGPRGVYDEGKRFGEALTTAYREHEGVDTGIVRIFNTYGPRMRPHDGRAIPTFVRQALLGEPLTVAGDGSQTRSVCFVDDLVRGILGVRRHRPPRPGEPRQPGGAHRAAHRARTCCGPSGRARASSTWGFRSTTPRCAGPTRRSRRSCSAGSRRCPGAKGSRARWSGSGRCRSTPGTTSASMPWPTHAPPDR